MLQIPPLRYQWSFRSGSSFASMRLGGLHNELRRPHCSPLFKSSAIGPSRRVMRCCIGSTYRARRKPPKVALLGWPVSSRFRLDGAKFWIRCTSILTRNHSWSFSSFLNVLAQLFVLFRESAFSWRNSCRSRAPTAVGHGHRGGPTGVGLRRAETSRVAVRWPSAG